jgi:hypothetical protein
MSEHYTLNSSSSSSANKQRRYCPQHIQKAYALQQAKLRESGQGDAFAERPMKRKTMVFDLGGRFGAKEGRGDRGAEGPRRKGSCDAMR